MSTTARLSDFGARLFSFFLIASGLAGIFATPSMARTFGIVDPSQEELLFYPGLAARNLGAGLAVLAFILTGQRKAIGTFFLCWVLVGFVDTKILLDYDGPVQSAGIHLMNICIITATGIGLLRT